MPPQTRAAARRVVSLTPLDTLPLPLALRIFALLPADARLLAAAVCHSWRVMLADPALWTRLDLSPASGVTNPSNALFRAAAARAGGQLEFLRTPAWLHDAHLELPAVLAANAGALRELALTKTHREPYLHLETVAELLRAAPGLRRLESSLTCQGAAALHVLRKEPPFGALSLTDLFVLDVTDIDWLAATDGLALHTSLEAVSLLRGWPEAEADSDAMVAALRSLPLLRSFCLSNCDVSAIVVARLLSCPALKSLRICEGPGEPLLDSPASAAVLCDALRTNPKLETLELSHVDFWHDVDAAAAVLATLQAHPSLHTLNISDNRVLLAADAAAAGAALGALIEHSPTLEGLHIYSCALNEAGLGPVVDALPRAQHLQALNCSDNNVSEVFARERLLPAVRACASLRRLVADGAYGFAGPAVQEAQLLLEQRR